MYIACMVHLKMYGVFSISYQYALCTNESVTGLSIGTIVSSVSQPRGRDPTWGRLAIFLGSRDCPPTF